MPVMSPKLGEFLVKTTHSKDLEDALNKIFSEYLELKLKTLKETINIFQKKWNMNFEEFKKHFKDSTLTKDVYTFDVEKDFWQWEESETLKKHYEEIKKQWSFLQVYFNELTGTTSFALIEKDKRIWGVDCDNMRGWHLHPLENPETHENTEKKTIGEIIKLLSEIWPCL